ncbi:MAG: c-type cytochrome domain-containing protein [Verrucomicrobiales bacterium]
MHGKSAAGVGGGFDWSAFLGPFHHVTLHFPIGFITLAFLLELVCVLRPATRPGLRKVIGPILWLSALSAVLVCGLGLLRAAAGGYQAEALTTHKLTGFAVAGITLVAAILYPFVHRGRAGKTWNPRRLRHFYRGLLFANMGLLAVAGHYGGNLTHGSDYLVKNAPDWVQQWFGETRARAIADAGSDPAAAFFLERVQPVFENKCFQCHGVEKQKGDYRMDEQELAMTAGESEIEPIVPGRPMESYLVEVVTLPEDDDYAMPPSGKERLTAEEVMDVIEWIYMGAPFAKSAVASQAAAGGGDGS